MMQYPSEEERLLKQRKKERLDLQRRIDACYNEELDLWDTGKLTELERERKDRDLMEILCREYEKTL